MSEGSDTGGDHAGVRRHELKGEVERHGMQGDDEEKSSLSLEELAQPRKFTQPDPEIEAEGSHILSRARGSKSR